jgi:hypothetical protein
VDILGAGSIASGSVPVGGLGASRLTVTLTAAGRFVGGAYDGTRAGAIVLTLRLRRAVGGTQRVRIPVGLFP